MIDNETRGALARQVGRAAEVMRTRRCISAADKGRLVVLLQACEQALLESLSPKRRAQVRNATPGGYARRSS